MYESYYSFTAEPFRLTPDHRMCFRHPSYQKAKTYMEYALRRREGFIMITGEPGTGKTTLINDLLDNLPTENLVTARLDSIHLESEELLRMVAFSFGLDGEALDRTTLLRNTTQFLTGQSKDGKKALLIVDEGQALSSSALEELRLLSNLQDSEGPLLQVFLVGQEGLLTVMQSPSMAQLHQRLIAACHLDPLAADQTEAYIKHRLRTVGWKGDPDLSDDIFPLIHKFSRGIPRRVNLICSRLLLSGYVHEKHTLDIEDVNRSIEDLREEKLTPSVDELGVESSGLAADSSAAESSNAVIEASRPIPFSNTRDMNGSKTDRLESRELRASIRQKQSTGRVAAFISLVVAAALTLILALYLGFQEPMEKTLSSTDNTNQSEQVVATQERGKVQEQTLNDPAVQESTDVEQVEIAQQSIIMAPSDTDTHQPQKLHSPGPVDKRQAIPLGEQSGDQGEDTKLDTAQQQEPDKVSDEHERLVVLSMDQRQPPSLHKEQTNQPSASVPNANADNRLQLSLSLEQANVTQRQQEQEAAKLLALAKLQRRYFKMTIPAGDNAFETYKKVLEVDADNREAQTGLADLVEFYRRRAVSYEEEGAYELSLEFINRGLKVEPSNTELLALQKQVKESLSIENKRK